MAKDPHRKKQTNLRIDPELITMLDQWCARQRPQVTRSAVLEMLIQDFLQAANSEEEAMHGTAFSAAFQAMEKRPRGRPPTPATNASRQRKTKRD